MRTSTQARVLASAGALAALAAAAAPSSALAAGPGSPFTCEASALSLSVLGQAPIEPITANKGAAACTNASSGIGNLTQPLPPIFGVSALNASTQAAGDYDKKQVLAAGGIADAKIGGLSSLGITLPDLSTLAQLPDGAKQITVPVPEPLATTLKLLGIQTPLVVDIQAAVDELLKYPTTDLLNAQAAVAYASGSCANGQPVLNSTRTVADVKVLGNTIALDTTNGQPIVDTQHIDLSQLDLTKIKIPVLDSLLPGVLPGIKASLNPIISQVLSALPPLDIPVSLAQVSVTPGAQTKTATSITQTGPTVNITVAGQPIANVTLGTAKVGSAGVDCSPQVTDAPTTAADTALACTKRRLVLVDVVQQGDKVLLTGAADKKFVGKFVTIKFKADGSNAARALVKPDGSFTTTAPLPSAKLRTTNLARYQASIGSEKSMELKLARRMTVQKLTSANGKVTIAGRVVQPLSTGAKTIELRRRVSCKKSVVVKRFKPAADGSYRVTVDAPEGLTAAVYRLATRVRKNTTNAKTFPTFTLPRGVDLVS